MKHNLICFVLLFSSGIAMGFLLANPPHAITENPVVERTYTKVIFSSRIIEQLNNEYGPNGPEALFCLIGKIKGDTLSIDRITKGGTLNAGLDFLVFDEDPPCQIPGSVGSLHTHPEQLGCEPSLDDMFTWGEMHSPEPAINAIQCGKNEVNIFAMPGKREAFDFTLVPWEKS